MNRYFICLCLAAGLMIQTGGAQSSKFRKWADSSFFRGFNVMDEDYIGHPYARVAADFVALKNTGANIAQIGTAGYDSVQAPYHPIPRVISRLDTLVMYARAAGLYYTIAVRSGPGRYDVADEALNPTLNKSTIWTNATEQKTYAHMLKVMAQRFLPDTLFAGLNLVVEPTPLYGKYDCPHRLDSALTANAINMKAIFKTFIDSVRTVDSKLPLIVQAVNWSDADFFGILQKQADTNIVYDVHCYTPFEYSHDTIKNHSTYPGVYQGTCANGLTPQTYNKTYIDTSVLKLVRQFQTVNHVPIYLGEFGMRWQQNGGEQYLSDVAHLAIAKGWSFTIWTFRSLAFFDYDVLKNSSGRPYMDTVKTFFIRSSTTGLGPVYTKENSISIYPNPTNGRTTIYNMSPGVKKIVVCDLLGNIVLEKLTEESQFDVQLASNGMYLIRVNGPDGFLAIRLVKQ